MIKIRNVIRDLPGWCTAKKAQMLYQIIQDNNCKLSVEIGVYGGRSLVPQALAHQKHTGGSVVGIDPWSANEALQDDLEHTKESVLSMDWTKLYLDLQEYLVRNNLLGVCSLVRTTSEDAVRIFADNSIDLLHIDGNHDFVKIKQDIELYLPKIKQGGYMWFDDFGYPTVIRAVEDLRKHHKTVHIDQNNICFKKT